MVNVEEPTDVKEQGLEVPKLGLRKGQKTSFPRNVKVGNTLKYRIMGEHTGPT